jgi:hypothetical protein
MLISLYNQSGNNGTPFASGAVSQPKANGVPSPCLPQNTAYRNFLVTAEANHCTLKPMAKLKSLPNETENKMCINFKEIAQRKNY